VERTGIEPVTSGLQNRVIGETVEDGRKRDAAQTRMIPGLAPFDLWSHALAGFVEIESFWR
jgi:hypothetical protein